VRRLRALLLALLLLVPGQTRAAQREDRITARAYVLLEAGSGRVLLGEGEHERLPMASTTKIMTALLAVEAGEALDTLVTVPREAAGVEGSSMHLAAGEKISLRDLLYGLMMVSGNDAAVALALHFSGSVEAFAERMNERAAALGCTDTHFVNPHGLHDPNHYTSAHDLACMAAAAMGEPLFRELVGTPVYSTATGDRARTFRTKNRMLTEVEGGCGVKTGFTKKAGRCLCFAARREGMLLIGAVLNAPDMWGDAKKLLDRGFAAFELRSFLAAGEVAGQVPVTGAAVDGAKKPLPVVAKTGILYPIRKDGRETVSLDIRLPASLEAPVAADTPLGEAVLLVDGERVLAAPLFAAEGAKRPSLGRVWQWVLERYLAP